MVTNSGRISFSTTGSWRIRQFIIMNNPGECNQNALPCQGKNHSTDKMRLLYLCPSYGYFDQTAKAESCFQNRSI
jgi:hypothetical protein